MNSYCQEDDYFSRLDHKRTLETESKILSRAFEKTNIQI